MREMMRNLSSILDIPDLSPEEARRRNLLNVILFAMVVSAILMGVALLITAPLGLAGEQGEVMLLNVSILVALLGVGIVYVLNRYVSGELAGTLFLVLLIALASFSDNPQQVVDGRGLFVFAIPILAASMLLRPWASFAAASASALSITIISLAVVHKPIPNVPAILGFFMLALVSWLSARSLESALKKLRNSNKLLQESKERYRFLFENATVGIGISDYSGKVLAMNNVMSRITGYTPKEFSKVNLRDTYVNLEDRKRLLDKTKQDGKVENFEVQLKRKNGEAYWASLSSRPITYNGKESFLTSALDITKRKQTEEELASNYTLLRIAGETAKFGGWSVDLQTNICTWSDTVADIHEMPRGYSPPVETGINFYAPEWRKKITKVFTDCAEKGIPYDEEMEIITKKGKRVWVRAAGEAVKDEHGKIVQLQGSFQDITERKRVEQKLRRLNSELTAKTKELERVLYATSHDLRSPLVNVQGFNKELQRSIRELNTLLKSKEVPQTVREKCAPILDQDISESLEYIVSSTAKMDALLSGLLTLSRIGRQELTIEKLNMNQIMQDVISEFGFKIKENNVKINISDLPQCDGDQSQINRVFSNLVGNALKFLHPERRGVIRISGKKEENHAIYIVEDNGIGIPLDQLKKIFDLFQQLDPVKPGKGLGLTIVKQILEKHQGTIDVDSKLGEGTRFTVSLPTDV